MIAVLSFFLPTAAVERVGADEGHDHHAHMQEVKPPRVYLDKSPRIVAYQLKRLSNAELLLVERGSDDAKYIPVHEAIVQRPGISPADRTAAAEALAILRQTTVTRELIGVIAGLDDDSSAALIRELAVLLPKRPMEELQSAAEPLRELSVSVNSQAAAAAFAALLVSDPQASAVPPDSTQRVAWLSAVPLLPTERRGADLHEAVLNLLQSADDPDVRRTAVSVLPDIPGFGATDIPQLLPLFKRSRYRPVVVESLLRYDVTDWNASDAGALAKAVVTIAEESDPADRTTAPFISMQQLADRLFSTLPVDQSRELRRRLDAVAVRVVVLKTVEEEMRYDRPWFAVEAGRPVQVILENDDLMPHNLVIAAPGALQEVAELGQAAGPDGGHEGRQYVPDSPLVLQATAMVQPAGQVRLTFEAPDEPGEYPYVCTFPRHWMRMYGVMVVVPDLAEFAQNPIPPKDPLGSTRSLVQNWKLEDFSESDLDQGLRGRSAELGERIFREATCAQCHVMRGQGGRVGPDLTEVLTRWKGDTRAVLREVLEPSHRIDPRYAVRLIITEDGRTVSGIVVEETRSAVSVLVNPEAPKPVVIPRKDIEEMVATSTSMMPKALLDRFTRDEILELIAWMKSIAEETAAASP